MIPDKLSKKDKAALRALIEKGVQAGYSAALTDIATTILQWQQQQLSNRDAYQLLYKKLQEHNTFIARRYDHISGSHYVTVVTAIYRDKQITDDDLLSLSEEVREYVKRIERL